jgi:hypothetical protein
MSGVGTPLPSTVIASKAEPFASLRRIVAYGLR